MDKQLELALEAAQNAGTAVMRYYPQTLAKHYKQDGSPVRIADQAAHRVTADRLVDSGLVVVSEEGEDLHLAAEHYWLVDQLDGTKDFLAGIGEFTVNIALVNQGRPLLDVVLAPAINELYWGAEGMEAWRIREGAEAALSAHTRPASLRMAVSRFHDHADVEIFAARNGITERLATGSAFKYGLLAAGEMDVFPCLVGSSEWDTAAGQAVLEAAGGQVLDRRTGEALQHGKPRRRNPRLLALRAPYRQEEFQLKEHESEFL